VPRPGGPLSQEALDNMLATLEAWQEDQQAVQVVALLVGLV